MKRILSTALVGALVLFGACGDDDDTETGSASAPTETTGGDEGEQAAGAVTVTVTPDSIDVPSEFAGGVVEVTVDSQVGSDEFDVSFARVAPGTSEDDFRTAILAAFEGESIDELIEAVTGVASSSGSTTETILIEPGEYFVFSEPDTGDEGGEEGGEEGAEDGGEEGGQESNLLIASTTVTEGEDGELPETDGTITAVDYGFEIDVQAGEHFTFVNDGPEQFHHTVLFGFGDIEASVVEENIKAFLEGEGPEDMPEALAGIEGDPYAGGSSVFSPGLGGTFGAPLESGNTYAAVCFISDRTGGPPHAIAHDMFEVFTVE